MKSNDAVLTPLELKILREICKGKSNREVAKKLGYSYRTIEAYKGDIYKKAKVKTPISLFIFAYKKKLIKL